MSEINVHASPFWDDAGIDIITGQSVRSAATGRWRDCMLEGNPAGYECCRLRPFGRAKRTASAPRFALISALDQDEATAFVIGDGVTHSLERGRRLWAYANDPRGYDANNSGWLALEMERALAGDDAEPSE